MKYTQWYPRWVKPVRKGWYQRSYWSNHRRGPHELADAGIGLEMDYWNGGGWFYLQGDLLFEVCEKGFPWRGIKEEIKTTSQIISSKCAGHLAEWMIAALTAEIGEPLSINICQFDYGSACNLSIRGHEHVFSYRSRLPNGERSAITPEDFVQFVAKEIKSSALHS